MKNGRQQHYNRVLGIFETSEDRFGGEFEATREEALAVFLIAKKGCRITRQTGLPNLYTIEG
jgi:hypothetical protein